MKKKLLLLLCLVLAGIGQMKAEDVREALVNQGWTLVENITSVDLANNYFVFVDGKAAETAMSRIPKQDYRPVYKPITNPMNDLSQVWVLEGSESSYKLKSFMDGRYINNSSEGWNNYMNASEGTSFTFTLDDGKYRLKANNDGSRQLGPWAGENHDKGVSLGNNGFENMAGNKSDDSCVGFYVYYKSRTAFTDVTNDFINNPGFENELQDWTKTGFDLTKMDRNNDADPKEGGVWYETWWNAGAMSLTQTLNNLPTGSYELQVALVDADQSIKFYAQPENGTRIETTADGQDFAKYYSLNLSLTAASNVTIGVECENRNAQKWFGIDNFKLIYNGARIENVATALPNGGAMEADKWYYFDINADATYNLTATTLSDIKSVSDGSKLESVAGTGLSAEAELTEGRYYVKSSSANNLVVTANSYVYNVGEGSCDKDGKYLQGGETVTITFPNAQTNDPDASLALVENAKATVGDTEVTLSTDGVTKGFKFTMPEVQTSKDYTISIPANIYGIADKQMNAEQSWTIHTPVILDCVRYLKNTDGNVENYPYITRQDAWATQATMSEFGLPINIITNEEGKTELKFVDNNLNLGDDGWMYGDCSGNRVVPFTVSKVENGYKFLNTRNNKYMAIWGTHVVGDAEEGNNLWAATNVWTLETAEEYLASMADLENSKAKAVATAAGYNDVTTKDALNTALAGHTNANTVSIGSTDVRESFQGYASNASSSEPDKIYKKTLFVLPGLYKLTVNGFDRSTSYSNYTTDMGDVRGAAYLYLGDKKVQLKSPLEEPSDVAYNTQNTEFGGKHYPNGTASAGEAFAAGKYLNTVYLYVEEATNLEFGIANPTRYGNDGERKHWICYQNVTLTSYGEYYDITKTALHEAGRINGEGEFARAETAGSNRFETPKYWTVESNYSDRPGLDKDPGYYTLNLERWDNGDATQNNRIYQKVTLPAGKYYFGRDLQAEAKSDNIYMFASKELVATSDIESSANVLAYQKISEGGMTEGSFPSISFTLTETSTVYLGFQADFPENQSNMRVRAVRLMSNHALATITLNAACNDGEKVYGTYSNASAFVVPANLTVSAVAVKDGKLVVNNYATDDVVPANTGVMVSAAKWESGTQDFNVSLTSDAGVEKENNLHPSSETMTGDNKFYRLTMHNGETIGFWWGAAEGAAFNLGANKAYLAVPTSSSVKAQGMWFNGDEDAIQTVESESSETAIYDMQGRRVSNTSKGLYIKNGRKYMVK